MKRFGIKGFLVFIGFVLLVVITSARLIASYSLEKTARETFGLSDLIAEYSGNSPWIGKDAPVVIAHVNEHNWSVARSRLLKYYGSATAIDGIDDPVRRAIVNQVGEERFEDVLVFVESDSIDGVIYCVIGRSKKNGPILFFVVQRI